MTFLSSKSTVGISTHIDIQYNTPPRIKSRIRMMKNKDYASDGLAGFQSSDHDDYTASPGDFSYLAGWSDRVKIGIAHMLDGSFVFLQTTKLGLLLTKRVVPVVKSTQIVSGEVVAKIKTAKLVDCSTVCHNNELLLVCIVYSRHFIDDASPSMTSALTSASLVVISASRRTTDNHSEYETNILDIQGRGKFEIFKNVDNYIRNDSNICLEIIHLEKEPLILVGNSEYVSCRQLVNCEAEIFKIDFSQLKLPKPVELKSPGAYLLSEYLEKNLKKKNDYEDDNYSSENPDEQISNVSRFSLHKVCVSLGRLIISGRVYNLDQNGNFVLSLL